MSVSPTSDAIPDPGFYTYTPSLPSGLSFGDPTIAPTSSSTTSTSASTTSGTDSYEASFQALQAYDNQELMSVSMSSPSAAASNVDSVLAQAAADQAQQQAAQASANAAADALPSSASVTTDSTASSGITVPTYESIITQSDSAAASALGAQDDADSTALLANQPLGSSIDTLA